MTEKPSPAGWVTPALLGADPPTFKYYEVSIADAAKAVEGVRAFEGMAKHRGPPREVHVDAVKTLTSQEIALIHLKAGELRRASSLAACLLDDVRDAWSCSPK